jgi:hypothetical protein
MSTEKSKLTVDQIKEALPDIDAVKALKESEEYDTTDFSETLAEALGTDGFDKDLVKSLTEGNASAYTVSDETLFQNALDTAIETVGEFNETATILALACYTGDITPVEKESEEEKADDTEKDEDTAVTLGELYALKEDHPWYSIESTLTKKALSELADECFAGEGRTYPITNIESAALALRLDNQNEKIQNLAAAYYGITIHSENGEVKENTIVPLLLTVSEGDWHGIYFLLEASSLEEVETLKEGLKAYDEETVEKVNEFLASAEEALNILLYVITRNRLCLR